MLQSLFRELSRIDGLAVETGVELSGLTTFKIGGAAGIFLRPFGIRALEQALSRLHSAGVQYRVLGRGSNLLISDSGVPVVVSLSGLQAMKLSGKGLAVQAGVPLARVLSWCLKNGLGGLEPLVGIPASAGGALFTNAGAHGCSMGEFVQEVMITTHEGSSWFKLDGSNFSYRKSGLPCSGIVSAMLLRTAVIPNKGEPMTRKALYPRSPSESLRDIRKAMKMRVASQPVGLSSAGCVFKNPEEAPAWKLIAWCGLQGLRNGDAQVSEKHANFIVNLGNARFAHVADLIEIIKQRVEEQTGISLREELIIWRSDALV